jgi:hypothetical protein
MVEKLNSVDESQHWFRRIVPDRQLQVQPALRHQMQKSHQDQRSNDLSHELFPLNKRSQEIRDEK